MSILRYIWLEHPEMERKMHVIGSVKSAEAGDDTEGKAYETICGQEFFSLQSGPPRPSFGTQEEGLSRGGKVCLACAIKVAKASKPQNDLAVKDLRCPICGYIGECFLKEIGKVDFQDKYTFHCPHCGFRKQETKYGGSAGGDDWATQCSFCGKEYIKHKQTPAELR